MNLLFIFLKFYNNQLACYWLEWLLGYEQLCFKENKVRKVGSRRNMPV